MQQSRSFFLENFFLIGNFINLGNTNVKNKTNRYLINLKLFSTFFYFFHVCIGKCVFILSFILPQDKFLKQVDTTFQTNGIIPKNCGFSIIKVFFIRNKNKIVQKKNSSRKKMARFQVTPFQFFFQKTQFCNNFFKDIFFAEIIISKQ